MITKGTILVANHNLYSGPKDELVTIEGKEYPVFDLDKKYLSIINETGKQHLFFLKPEDNAYYGNFFKLKNDQQSSIDQSSIDQSSFPQSSIPQSSIPQSCMNQPQYRPKTVPIDTRALAALDTQARLENLSLNQKINEILLGTAKQLPHFQSDPDHPDNLKQLALDNRGRKSAKKQW